MRRGNILGFGVLSLCLFAVQTFAQAPVGSPVDVHGFLHTADLKNNGRLTIADKNDKATQLVGMSLFWSGWAGQFYNRKTVGWLASDWKISVVRAAIGVDGNGNYLDSVNKGAEANLLRADSVIQAAIDYGIYVVIDWHDHYAINHTAKSVEFFQRMARKWGAYPNVIYEIYNEPMGADVNTESSEIPHEEIEAYSDTVIAAIRAIDTANLILVGNRAWDQNPSDFVGSFLNTKYRNIAYTLHFYAGSHSAALRTEGNNAMAGGLALFLSEWGTSAADGGSPTGPSKGAIYLTEAEKWMTWAKTNNLSWCNWSVVAKNESSAALLPAAGSKGWWTDSVISPSGLYVRGKTRELNAAMVYPPPPEGDKPDTASVPGRIQSEGFTAMSGVQTESGADEDRTDDLGYIEHNDWADYMVNVTSTGPFYFHARVASNGLGGKLVLKNEAGKSLAAAVVPVTGGWQIWQTVTDSVNMVTLPLGLVRLRLSFQGTDPAATKSLFNLNWVELNDRIDPVLPKRRSGVSWKVSGGAMFLEGIDKKWSTIRVRNLEGRLISQSQVSNGTAQLAIPSNSILFAELSGPGGREVWKILGN
jgi:endoglucanase